MLVCVCVSAGKHVYAPGAFSGNLTDYVASPGGPRQVSVSGCVSSAHASSHALEAGASWSRQFEPSISPNVTCMPPNTVKYLRSPPLNTYTSHAQTQYTMETIHRR